MATTMLRALPNRVLVKLLPRYGDVESKLHLVVVDRKKDFEGSRRAEVLAIGRGITQVKAGDVVWFHGAQGQSFDRDERGANDGTAMRRLRMKDLLAVEEEGVV